MLAVHPRVPGLESSLLCILRDPSPSSIPPWSQLPNPFSLLSLLQASPLLSSGDQGARGPVIPLAVLCLLVLRRTSEPCTGGFYCTRCGKNIHLTYGHRLQHNEGLGAEWKVSMENKRDICNMFNNKYTFYKAKQIAVSSFVL